MPINLSALWMSTLHFMLCCSNNVRAKIMNFAALNDCVNALSKLKRPLSSQPQLQIWLVSVSFWSRALISALLFFYSLYLSAATDCLRLCIFQMHQQVKTRRIEVSLFLFATSAEETLFKAFTFEFLQFFCVFLAKSGLFIVTPGHERATRCQIPGLHSSETWNDLTRHIQGFYT